MCVDSRNEKWKHADIRGDHSFLGGWSPTLAEVYRGMSAWRQCLCPRAGLEAGRGHLGEGSGVWLWDLISFLFQRWSQAAKVVASPDTGFCDPQPGFHLREAVLRPLQVVDFGVSSALLPGTSASAVTASAQTLVGQAWNILTFLPGPLVPSPFPPLATPPPYCPTFRSCLYPRLPVSGGIPDLLLRFLAT